MKQHKTKSAHPGTKAPHGYMTVKQAQAALAVGHSTMFKYMNNGEIKSVFILGRRLIRVEEIERILRGE